MRYSSATMTLAPWVCLLYTSDAADDLSPRKAEMQQEMTRIYASHFTEAELKEALTFYKTPLGKKLIAEEPKALEESMKAADDWSRTFATEVDSKFRAEMQKRGKSLM